MSIENDNKGQETPPGSSPEKAPGQQPPESAEAKAARLEAEIAEKESKVAGLQREETDLLGRISNLRTERRTLKSETPPPAPNNPPADPGDGGKGTQDASKALADAAERRAIRQFVTKHPEYADDSKWRTLTTLYSARRGKLIWEEVFDDLEDAHLLVNRDSVARDAASKATAEAARKMLAVDKAAIGGTSSAVKNDNPKVMSETDQKELARLQKVDPSFTAEKFMKRKEKMLG